MVRVATHETNLRVLCRPASASPEQVLAAATDLSEDRVKVWSNSKPQHFEVHAQGAGFAEVTEGFRPPFGDVWERSRYEWSLERSARP